MTEPEPAKKPDRCRICDVEIKTQIFKGTGYCGTNHYKQGTGAE